MRSVAILTISLVSSWQSTPASSRSAEAVIGAAQFERLSFDLRGHGISASERADIGRAVTVDRASQLYAQDADAWLTKDSLKGFVGTYLKFAPLAVISPDGESFFHRTALSGDVLFLPGADDAACANKDVISVSAWWSKAPVRVCKASYVPDKIFDSVGYCSGGAEPLLSQPLRPGCGCGPMLIGCLPPVGKNQPLDQLVKSSIADEWFETAARIVAENRPLDELMTTTRTWQSGFAELLYARREVLTDLKTHAWGDATAARLARRLESIDVYAPARWVERASGYKGTGIWWTALVAQALKIPTRAGAHHMLDRYLCSPFVSANVDTDAVLAAVGDHPENLRTLSSLTSAPMRFQVGCKGCHSPMDGVGGFMGDLEGSIYGSYVTNKRTTGELFVTGDHDFRGKGSGVAALSAMVVKTADFETCAVKRAFEQVMQASPTVRDTEVISQLTKQFHDNGHRWAPILHALLVSDTYLHPGSVASSRDGAAPHEVPATVAKAIDAACIRCHDKTHELDLTKLPDASDSATWKAILTRVSDSSMPPGKMDDDLADRFPLDPTDRRALISGVTSLLGSALDTPLPPRRLPHKVWLGIVRSLAEPQLGHDSVEELLAPLVKTTGFFGKLPSRGLPPPYLLALQSTSESVCRALAATNHPSVQQLMTTIFGVAPNEDDLAAQIKLLTKFEERTRDPREAWTALCSSQLSGTRLLFSDYVGRAAR